ncbi:hypothetical protein [Rhodococcus sp. SJ-2]
MSNLAKYWPTIRQVVYGLLAAALALAAGAGWITQDDADQWLAQAVTLLGAIGFVVAGLFVDKTSPAQEQKIENAVRVGVEQAAWAASPAVDAVIERAGQHAQSELERVRAEAERLLGR